ncbi:MAG: hypothetical protein AAF413_03695 [Patescibacteria group bacterium]
MESTDFRKMHMMVGIILTFAIALFAISSVVIAQESSLESDSDKTQTRQERIEELQQAAAERREQAQAAREEAVTKTREDRIAACEARKDKIQGVMQNTRVRGQNFKQKVDNFVDRVDGLVSSGELDVANYDRLVSDINAAQETAEADLDVVKSLRTELDCDDPDTTRDNVDAYKEAMAAFKASAKEYVDAAKTFAEAVKVAADSRGV